MSKTTLIPLAKYFLLISLFVPLLAHCGPEGDVREIPTSQYSGSVNGWGVKGKILEAKTWLEGKDSSVLVVSGIHQGKVCEKNHSSGLYGYRFLKKDGNWTKLWEIKEYNQSACQSIQYEDSTLRVFDVDGKDLAETIFFYFVAQDGADPIDTKMMLHWNTKKAPIRGKIPWTQDDIAYYEMNLDPKLRAAPEVVRNFAIAHWKAYVTKSYGDVIQFPPAKK